MAAHTMAYRKLTHEHYRKVVEARQGDTLTQALNLSKSIRELTPQQHAVLDQLFRVFSETPKLRSEESILRALRIKMQGSMPC